MQAAGLANQEGRMGCTRLILVLIWCYGVGYEIYPHESASYPTRRSRVGYDALECGSISYPTNKTPDEDFILWYNPIFDQ